MSVQKPASLTGGNGLLVLEFVEREAASESAMRLGIPLSSAGLSLTDTASVLAGLRVQRCRTTVHKLDPEGRSRSSEGHGPNQVAIDETVIQANDRRYWLCEVADPATTRLASRAAIVRPEPPR